MIFIENQRIVQAAIFQKNFRKGAAKRPECDFCHNMARCYFVTL